ncbi:MAG: hypothetical protein HUJ27_12390 [Rhodobacteraceae bacterium]|nr:hypothetical protein [Paracoccaceae bacterium]
MMNPILLTEIKDTLKGCEHFDWHEPVLRAVRAADQGNERALVELVYTVKSTEGMRDIHGFQSVVLSRCHDLQSQREKLECALVCKDLGFKDDGYSMLRTLSDEGYWPAQFRLGYLLLMDTGFASYPDDGYKFLKASVGPGHRDGIVASLAFKARHCRRLLRSRYFLLGIIGIPFFLVLALPAAPFVIHNPRRKFGEPEEASQLDD